MNDANDRYRAQFPRGLEQPENGFRFSMDSLLLSCFARVRKNWRGLDLGTGCGAISLALLLNNPELGLSITGLDSNPDMVTFANKNSYNLKFDYSFTSLLFDVSNYKATTHSFDFALCNPPYRVTGKGRTNPDPGKNAARFESESGLRAFTDCAKRCLKDKAPLFLVHLPERLTEILKTLNDSGLKPKRIRMVHGNFKKPARIVLIEARKNSNPGLEVEPPLVLYHHNRNSRCLTDQALAFCPFLQCNAKNSETDNDTR